MDTQTVKDRLANIIRDATRLYEMISDTEPSLPPAAQERFDKGEECLECKQALGKGRVKRGCHERCYRRIVRAIEKKKYTDFDAIRAGSLAPKQSGGRPSQLTELEQLLGISLTIKNENN